MHVEVSCSTFTLSSAGVLTVADGVGTRIVCRSGSLWVTQEGDVKDSIIGPDEAMTIRKPGRTVITALESAALTLIEPHAGHDSGETTRRRRASRLVAGSLACS